MNKKPLLLLIILLIIPLTNAELLNISLYKPINYNNRELSLANIGSHGSVILYVNDKSAKISLNNPVTVYGLEILLKDSTPDQATIEINQIVECITSNECNDGNPCTFDECFKGGCTYKSLKQGCSLNNKCVDQGYIASINKALSYCKDGWQKQKTLGQNCDNNYECLSGICDSVCKKTLPTTYSVKENNAKPYIFYSIFVILILITLFLIWGAKWKRKY